MEAAISDRYLYDAWGNPIRHIYDEDTGLTHFETTQDCEPIVEHNKALQNEGDGYSPGREMRRLGSVPYNLALQWAQEKGIDAVTFRSWPRKEQAQFLLEQEQWEAFQDELKADPDYERWSKQLEDEHEHDCA